VERIPLRAALSTGQTHLLRLNAAIFRSAHLLLELRVFLSVNCSLYKVAELFKMHCTDPRREVTESRAKALPSE
jgi:hypothetical protein